MSTNNDKDMQAEREANLPKLTELMKLDLTDMHTKLVERMDYWMCEALKARAALTAAPVAADPDRWHSLTCDGTCSPPCKDATPPQQEGQSIEHDHVFQDMIGDWHELASEEKHADANKAWKAMCKYIDTRSTPASTPAAADIDKPLHEEIITERGNWVCTACGTTTPITPAAASGEPSDGEIYEAVSRRSMSPEDLAAHDAMMEEIGVELRAAASGEALSDEQIIDALHTNGVDTLHGPTKSHCSAKSAVAAA